MPPVRYMLESPDGFDVASPARNSPSTEVVGQTKPSRHYMQGIPRYTLPPGSDRFGLLTWRL